MSKQTKSFDTSDQVYQIPALAHDVLRIEHANGKVESHTAGMIKQVKVPVGGVTLRFLSGGGKEMQEPIRLVYKAPPKPEKPAVVTGPPPIELLKDQDDSDKPLQVPLVTPPPSPLAPPKGEALKVSDQADATIDKK